MQGARETLAGYANNSRAGARSCGCGAAARPAGRGRLAVPASDADGARKLDIKSASAGVYSLRGGLCSGPRVLCAGALRVSVSAAAGIVSGVFSDASGAALGLCLVLCWALYARVCVRALRVYVFPFPASCRRSGALVVRLARFPAQTGKT